MAAIILADYGAGFLGERRRPAFNRAAPNPRTTRMFVLALGAFIVTIAARPPLACAAQDSNHSASAQSTIQLAQPKVYSGPPLTITLQDALQRAEKNSPQFRAAATAVKAAEEGRKQARAAMLPSFSSTVQDLITQGDGISPVGRFVSNDGIHVYRAWGVVRETMPGSFFIDAGPRTAAYREALTRAQEEIAQRGLNLTVTTDYYALLVAQRAYATAQVTLNNARRFLQISQALEQGGEVAHTDVIRFQLQYNQQKQALQNAQLAVSTARANLAVLLFPAFNENFTVVDDLDIPPALPGFGEIESMAKNNNPQIRAALASYRQSKLNVSVARAAFYPSFSIDFDYGIEANAFALHSINTTKPGVVQPNLGFFVTGIVNIPVWDWGSRLSRLRVAKDQRELQQVNVSFAQRQLLNQLYSFYNRALTARDQLNTLRNSQQLASHNLQLVTMQYRAGAATVLQVLDAVNSLNGARDAYASGGARYRDALAQLQTLTGSF
ncbi:MAG: TolC family protein [Bryobacteraceae bacterium]